MHVHVYLVKRSPCYDILCQNDGQCEQLLSVNGDVLSNDFRCDCPPNYQDTYCEQGMFLYQPNLPYTYKSGTLIVFKNNIH